MPDGVPVAARASCPPDAVFVALVERRLPGSESDALEAHVRTCPTCRDLVRGLSLAGGVSTAGPSQAGVSSAPGAAALLVARAAAGTRARGATLGRYLVMSLVGSGGMGEVYAAYDPELDRRVAVKLLRTAAESADARKRLSREAWALAQLSHPNVVPVFDVGEQDGDVFVAMELVAGETLRAWLRSERSWRDVVRMYVQAGRGLAAAHEAGIVHRDFKPDNALVGDDGRVRVVDFGLAWTSGPSAPESTREVRGSAVGTPRYGPPEQLRGQRVDARADQFAFCASLWEALFGQTPFAGDDLRTLLANAQEGKLRDVPAKGVPSRVRDALRRGLSADPAARFPSMDALLEALEHDPWIVRRRWLGATAAVAVVAGVVVGGRALDASRERERAALCSGGESKFAAVWGPGQRQAVETALAASGKPWAGQTAALVTGVLDVYGHDWVSMRRDACEATSVRHEQSEALLDARMQCLDGRLDEMRALVTLLSRPEDSLIQTAPKAVYALSAVRGCADAQALLAPLSPPGDPAAREKVEAVRRGLAQVRAMYSLAQFRQAEPLAADLVAQAQSLGYAPLEAEALSEHAGILDEVSDYTRSVDEYRRALWAAERGRDSNLAVAVMIELVWVLGLDLGRYEPAHDYAAQAAAILAGSGGDAELQGSLDSREGAMLVEEGRLAEAERLERRAIEERRAVFGSAHPKLAAALTNLAVLLDERGGQDEESLAFAQEAVTVFRSVLGEHHPDYATALQNVAAGLKEVGRTEEARSAGEEAVAVLRDALGPDNGKVANAEASLGLTLIELGDAVEAERLLRHAVVVTERLRGTDNVWVANHQVSLADALTKQQRYAEAAALYRTAMVILARDGDNAYWGYRARARLGVALLGARRPTEALAELEAVLRWQQDNEHTARELGLTRLALARALRATGGDRARARSLAELAVADFSSSPAARADLAEAKQWLAREP